MAKKKEVSGNGFVRYSIKESLEGLHYKIDEVNTRLANGDQKFIKLETRQKMHDRMIWGIFGILAGLLSLTLKLTGVI